MEDVGSIPRENSRVHLTGAMLLFVLGWRTAPQTVVSSIPQAVTTYHNDNLRTGWNSNETLLTPLNVNSTTFGLLHSVPLDEQVDGQPLVVPGVTITAGQYQGTHDVVYVATENNTVYAIDASSGVILLSPNFGTPVSTPTCMSPTVGITSTPVIDVASNTMYVIVYSTVAGVPTYTLHALDLGNLQDKVAPAVVKAAHALAGGTKFYRFDATVSRQRPALLEANGNIYAAFGSFCDHHPSRTRGWVLGWNASTLALLPSNKLTDSQTMPKSDYYLSSVWMSGYGVAGDAEGNVYFVTGNSDPKNDVDDSVTDIPESVVKLTPRLSRVISFFTPANESFLDQKDRDYGSGGVLLLPSQPGPIPNLAAAAGKEGNLFLLNRNALGGFDPNNKGIVGVVPIGFCWCGPSYFSDGVGHIVSSGGFTVKLWTVQTSSSTVKLVKSGSQAISSGQDPGFFTSVSSSGTSNAIIWAVSRPLSMTDTNVQLYAINATPSNDTLPILFQANAGSWPNVKGNANLVSTIANGHVYVASYQQLSIFGLIGFDARTVRIASKPGAQDVGHGSEHEIFGTIMTVKGSRFILQTRTHRLVQVDAAPAVQNELSTDLMVGGVVDVRGTLDSNGVLQAAVIQRAKDSSDLWPNDI